MKLALLTFAICATLHSFCQPPTDSTSSRRSFEQLKKDAVSIWPNPFLSNFYIRVRQEGLVIRHVYLYDRLGNRVVDQKVSSILAAPIKIVTAELQPGNYYLVVETNLQPVRLHLVRN